jgi:glutamyl-tRNA reductase
LAVEKLDRVIPLIRHVEDSWSYLEADIRQKIQTYVENLPKEEIENIDIFLSIQGLKSFAEKRLKKATRTELDEAIFFVIPLQVSDRIIELYSESRNFDQANNFASTVIRYATDYSKEQIQKIISVCGDNDQIKHSFDVGSVINSIRKNKNANDDEIDGWLVEADLKRFAKIKDNEADVGN